MKKIEFGYSNDVDPRGTHQGMGIKPGLLLTEADYYGAFKYDSNSYIVAKVTKDEYGRFTHLVDKFIVRPAIADMYVDGSGIIFLDQEESIISQQIEQYLNSAGIKEKITSINDVLNNCNGLNRSDMSFKFLTLGDVIFTTSITHEAFARKNEAIKNCRGSFSQLQEHIINQEQIISMNNSHKR